MLIYFNGEDYDKAANLEAFPPKNQINTYMIWATKIIESSSIHNRFWKELNNKILLLQPAQNGLEWSWVKEEFMRNNMNICRTNTEMQ